MSHTSPRTWAAGALGGLLALSVVAPAAAGSNATAGAPAATARQAAFTAAATRSGVPEPLLLALSYAETRWEGHAGSPSAAGGYGPMHLVDRFAVSGRGDAGRAGSAISPLARAARLTGAPAAALRTDAAANISGGAALLASYARELGGGRLPATLGGWYAAVARYSGSRDRTGAAEFAEDVFATLAGGAAATTSDGQVLRLAGVPGVRPDRSALARLSLRASPTAAEAECPAGLDCRFIPAAYEQNDPDDPSNYGNYDLANRPRDLKINYIVIHDTEVRYRPTIAIFQNPLAYVSAHYVIRSSDGQVTQMVRTRNVAWHAGNWYVNMHSIGIEHEGFAEAGGAWYTEAMYRSSARLVRYLAERFDIPLDRQHILGHDDVPGPLPGYTGGMHWDPGPFWDWTHYMALLGAPITGRSGTGSPVVTIAPDFGTKAPVNSCDGTSRLPAQGSNFVYLHTAPSRNAPKVSDPTLHPYGGAGTRRACDWGDKAVAGQQFARAGRSGDWTAIWYVGQKAWFEDPVTDRTAVPGTGLLVTPRSGLDSIPVYGRAYPVPSAYPEAIPVQVVAPIEYTIAAGQRYVLGGRASTDYYYATTIDDSAPGDHTVVRGDTRYYQIQLGHRIAYVRASDVTLMR